MYKPIAWKKGDVITTQRLKHLQQGIVDTQKELSNYNDIYNVTINKNNQSYIMNKTANQIWKALQDNKTVIANFLINQNGKQIYKKEILTEAQKEQEGNFLFFLSIPNLIGCFKAQKGDEYPTYVGF